MVTILHGYDHGVEAVLADQFDDLFGTVVGHENIHAATGHDIKHPLMVYVVVKI